MSDKPTILIVATYATVEEAEADYKELLDSHKEGDLGHLAVGIVSKDADGKVKLHRHDTTTKHLAWGGAAVGAVLGLLVPPVGIPLLATTAVGAGAIAGAGAIVGHVWHNIPRKELHELGEEIDNSSAALVAVAVDKREEEIEKALNHAAKKVTKKMEKGDIEAAYEAAVAGIVKADEAAEA